jgi:hypothetical protein
MKILNAHDKKKKTQYIIASIIAILILCLWVTLPVLDSGMGKGGSSSYGMQKKSADLALLDSAGVDAPGQPLNGSMIDNPATSLDLTASSLFKMPGQDGEAASDIASSESSSVDSDSEKIDSDVSAPNVPVPSADKGFTKGKLSRLPSLSSGGGSSLTVGGNHSKFFGQENVKADLVPLNTNSNDIKSTKNNVALSALKHAEQGSFMAANAKNADAAKSSATSAFEKTKKTDESFLNSKEEKEYSKSGVEFSNAVSDLKKSDPSLSKKKIALPQPVKDEDESKQMEEQIKQMLLQMIIQATVGQVFGAIGQMMSMQMCPQCYKTQTTTK